MRRIARGCDDSIASEGRIEGAKDGKQINKESVSYLDEQTYDEAMGT